MKALIISLGLLGLSQMAEATTLNCFKSNRISTTKLELNIESGSAQGPFYFQDGTSGTLTEINSSFAGTYGLKDQGVTATVYEGVLKDEKGNPAVLQVSKQQSFAIHACRTRLCEPIDPEPNPQPVNPSLKGQLEYLGQTFTFTCHEYP